MPTYEYECEKCGKTFDVFQSMKDEPLKVCPRELCGRKVWGKGKVKRLLGTGAGVIFKGSGFYITDYRSAGYKEAAKKETETAAAKPAAAAGGAGGETGKSAKSEAAGSSAKVAAKAETKAAARAHGPKAKGEKG